MKITVVNCSFRESVWDNFLALLAGKNRIKCANQLASEASTSMLVSNICIFNRLLVLQGIAWHVKAH